MPVFEKKNFVLVTKEPGLQTVDITRDPDFQEELQAFKDKKFKERHPDRNDVNHSPYNFHIDNMYLDPIDGHAGKIKENLLVKDLCVPMKNEDGTENKDGVIILEREEDVVKLWNACASKGRNDMYLDTRFGKDLSPESKKKCRGMSVKEEAGVKDDLMKGGKSRVPKQ